MSLNPVILASGSATRQKMLQAAGVPIVIDRPNVDEDALKMLCRARGLGVEETAEALALAKAEEVQARHPGRLVLGADQMLECAGTWFDKPPDRMAAAQQLMQLAGRTHRLFSAVVAVRDGVMVWRAVDVAELTIRPLSSDYIESYLDQVGDPVLTSVGGYQLEGLGIQLFSAIRGSHFTILGMPLLPLLAFLRAEGVVAT